MKPRSRLLLPSLLIALLAPVGTALWYGVTVVFSATFDGVTEGPGNGVSFPAKIGKLLVFTGNGQPLSTIAPRTGIYSGELRLTDAGGDPTVDFGVVALPNRDLPTGLSVSFEIRFEQGSDFSVNVSDTTGLDISRVKFDGGGGVKINGKGAPGGQAVPGKDYRVDVYLAPKASGNDVFLVLLSSVESGRLLGSWTGLIPGGYRPAAAVTFTKCGSAAGSVTIDTIKVTAID